jgi:branched-chain amino acid transport system permease protein
MGWQFYIATVLVFFGVNTIGVLGLNLQYGMTGIMNFGFVLFQAAGAYAVALTTLGAPTPFDFQHYLFGASLPWPLPLLVAGAAGGALSLIVGLFALRPRDRGYQAMILLITLVLVTTLVEAEPHWLNGVQGLANIPAPFSGVLHLSFVGYKWFYAGLTIGIAAIFIVLTNFLTGAPFGRRLRAIRDNPVSAAALGVNVDMGSMVAFVIGGVLAGISGGLLAQYIGEWSPGSFEIFESFLYLVAITIGGTANNGGVILGSAVVLTGILDGVKYLPVIGSGVLVGAIQVVGISLLFLVFLWARPQGLLPERRRRFAPIPPAGGTGLIAGTSFLDGPSPLERIVARTRSRAGAPPRAGVGPPVGGATSRASGRAEEVPEDVISVVDVRRSFGGVQAVDGASFSLRGGQITALIGPNGAGKSTVLGLIAGTDAPDSGTILYRGTEIAGRPPHQIAHRGVIRTFQLSSEFGKMTVLENLLVAAPGQKGRGPFGALLGPWYWRRDHQRHLARALQLIEQFELTRVKDDFAQELSGGQKRLLEIARALMADPDVLLLDEPLAGIAPALREEVQRHLMRLRDGGLTMLMVEHALEVVDQVADSVVCMGQGKVIATGRMAELRMSEEVMDAFLVS